MGARELYKPESEIRAMRRLVANRISPISVDGGGGKRKRLMRESRLIAAVAEVGLVRKEEGDGKPD